MKVEDATYKKGWKMCTYKVGVPVRETDNRVSPALWPTWVFMTVLSFYSVSNER